MFGLSTIKLIAVALLLAFVMSLMGATAYFHSKWIDAEKQVATTQVELNNAVAAAKECSTATEALRQDSQVKAEEVKKAQDQAAVLAKNNRAIADRVLALQPSGDTSKENCQSIEDLHKAYKDEVKKNGK